MEARILEMNPTALCCSNGLECLNGINAMRNEKVILIIWSGPVNDLLLHVHSHPSLFAIFIYAKKRSYIHDRLCNQYSKIIDVFTEPDILIRRVLETIEAMERIIMAFNLFDQKQKSVRDLSKTSACFIWHELLIDVLKKLPPDEQSKNEMLTMCENFYAGKEKELAKIAEFRQSYTPEKAIEWYTDESFLYKLLNKALRTEDIDLLYLFRFFIIDLSNALEYESKKLKGNGCITLYRGQIISNRELEELHASVGQLILFNGFISTSRNKSVALRFAQKRSGIHMDWKMCLIEIHADPSLKSVVAADIRLFSKMQEEEEVLFGLGTTFKVESIEMDQALDLWKVNLITTDEGRERSQEYMRAHKEMMKEYSPLITFGRLLWNEMDQIGRAEQYFTKLLTSVTSDHPDIADIYNGIGCVYAKKGELNLALKNYKDAYELRKQKLKETDPKIAASLHNIGVIYRAQGKTDSALDSFCQALIIHEKNYSGDHEDKGYTIESIGLAYRSKGDFETALMWLNRALDMNKRLFPAEHPQIAACLGSIGSVYEETGELDVALRYYYGQLDMEEKCLYPDHSKLLKHLKWIARIYMKKNNPEKALAIHQAKLEAQRKILDENHPNIAMRLMTMGDLLKRPTEYYSQALKILNTGVSPDLPLKIKCLDTLSTVTLNQGNAQLSLKHQQHILETCYQIYEQNHPEIALRLQKIADIYLENLHNYKEAFHYYTQSLTIYQTIYNPRRKEIFDIQNKIRKVQAKLAGEPIQTSQDNVNDDEFSPFD